MATFEASKKLMRETVDIKDKHNARQEIGPQIEDNTLLRKLEIFESDCNGLIRLMHQVKCTGFNAAAPRLLYSSN